MNAASSLVWHEVALTGDSAHRFEQQITDLVPFLSQNQLLVKVSRGEAPSATQWAVYLGASLLLAAVLWLAAVWRYRQERLAISA